MYATPSQISYISHLVSRKGFSSVIAACEEYGLGLKGERDLTKGEASELIEWLKKAAPSAEVLALGQTREDEFEARLAGYKAANAALHLARGE